MPPREKISKKDVLQQAFLMTRESGFESITARGLAQRIGCSTQPIFRAYANMRQLKQEVWEKTRTFFS